MTHYEKPYIIAEAGCNHKGDMEIAKELINVAAMFCHADAIKFQKRCPKGGYGRNVVPRDPFQPDHPRRGCALRLHRSQNQGKIPEWRKSP